MLCPLSRMKSVGASVCDHCTEVVCISVCLVVGGFASHSHACTLIHTHTHTHTLILQELVIQQQKKAELTDAINVLKEDIKQLRHSVKEHSSAIHPHLGKDK